MDKSKVTHAMKCWPPYFDAVLSGDKRFELRRDDRDGFLIGDELVLREFVHGHDDTPGRYTGRQCSTRITYVVRGPCLAEGYVALGVGPVYDFKNDIRTSRHLIESHRDEATAYAGHLIRELGHSPSAPKPSGDEIELACSRCDCKIVVFQDGESWKTRGEGSSQCKGNQ